MARHRDHIIMYLDVYCGISPEAAATFDRKKHTRTRPEWKRLRRKDAHESRRRNRL